MRSASVERRLPALALCLLAGCGGGKALEGSLAEVLTLDYTRAELGLGPAELTLRFLRPYGTGEDTVLKLAVATGGEELAPNVALNLAEELAGGSPRGSVSRHVYDDPDHRALPKLLHGELLLRRKPVEGARVQGSFSATFVQGPEAVFGKTVSGDFDAEVLP